MVERRTARSDWPLRQNRRLQAQNGKCACIRYLSTSQPNRASHPSSRAGGEIVNKIQALSPQNDAQRAVQVQASGLAIDLGKLRWLMLEQESTSISIPLLAVLVFWLAIVFGSFGLFAPPNATVIATLFLCALSVSGAIFLILEMYTPFQGLIQISDAPVRTALAHLGQ